VEHDAPTTTALSLRLSPKHGLRDFLEKWSQLAPRKSDKSFSLITFARFAHFYQGFKNL